ncbi:hypothetical protein [Vibrio alginolyticus]|uniref:hypothetical protein n=1 Tax=Vibrio alginolyticus TaxID=663 RepID=UPI001BD303E4|nr:hypothetical protein [Vibrio alginolyticus]MBT0003201.1 hypothetical protein [Vibrio alginolyticus]
MESIYNVIQKNPEYFAWVFGVVNVLWGLFVYFNKQTHDKNLRQLEQELRYKADRRLKIFDLKAREYSKYVTDLDTFGKKNQEALPEKMQPIINEYMRRYLAANQLGDTEQEHQAIGWFGTQISTLIQEGSKDVNRLKSESNRLKLIATDEMLITFKELESLTEQSMNRANEFMKSFVNVVVSNDQGKIDSYQSEASDLALKIQEKSEVLLNQMRKELADI